MPAVLFAVASIVLALVLSVLRKIYCQIGKNQHFAAQLPAKNQRALRYIGDHKGAADIFLVSAEALFLAIAAVLLGRHSPLLGLAVSYVSLVAVFLAIPRLKSSKMSKRLAYAAAPSVRVCLERLRPPLQKITPALSRFHKKQTDSGVYTRDDLLEFIKRQKHADNNTISDKELDGLAARIEFANKKAKDVMTRKNHAKIVGASEAIGPVLINELHETGRQYFLVEEEFNKEIIGTLSVAELVDLKKAGDVKTAMDGKLFYLNEKNTLFECLGAFSKTGSSVFVVVNSDEDITGIININDVITELIGVKTADDFDMYDSLEAVAEGRYDAQDG